MISTKIFQRFKGYWPRRCLFCAAEMTDTIFVLPQLNGLLSGYMALGGWAKGKETNLDCPRINLDCY